MTDTPAPTARDTRGRFQPGISGNPAGKKPGTLNHATRLRLMLEDGDFEAAARHIIVRARDGDLRAACFLVDRLDPKPRGRPITLDLPDDATPAERLAAVTRAMCHGEITPAEAKTMVAVFAAGKAAAALHPTSISRSGAAPAARPSVVPGPHAGAGWERAKAAPDLHFASILSAERPSSPASRASFLTSTSLSRPGGWPASDLHRAAA
jgi:hypothetical protein